MIGEVDIHKVPGNFHISSHDFGDAYQRLYWENYRVPMKHKINHLSFGNPKEIQEIKSRFGRRMSNELVGTTVLSEPFRGGQLYVEYVLDITEAEFEDTSVPRDDKGQYPTQSAFEYRSMKTVMTN
jgi:Endoplasmic reticulum vesicle transporter